MTKDFDEEIYITVALDEYLELKEIFDFMQILKEYGIEEWENFHDALDDFLEEDPQRDDPRDLI